MTFFLNPIFIDIMHDVYAMFITYIHTFCGCVLRETTKDIIKFKLLKINDSSITIS